jgi:hypothetical protein
MRGWAEGMRELVEGVAFGEGAGDGSVDGRSPPGGFAMGCSGLTGRPGWPGPPGDTGGGTTT